MRQKARNKPGIRIKQDRSKNETGKPGEKGKKVNLSVSSMVLLAAFMLLCFSFFYAAELRCKWKQEETTRKQPEQVKRNVNSTIELRNRAVYSDEAEFYLEGRYRGKKSSKGRGAAVASLTVSPTTNWTNSTGPFSIQKGTVENAVAILYDTTMVQ